MASVENLGIQAETHSLFPNAFRCQQLRVIGNLAEKLSVGKFEDPIHLKRLSVTNFDRGAAKIDLFKYGGNLTAHRHVRTVIEVTYDENGFNPPFVRAERKIFTASEESKTAFDANSWSEDGMSLFSIGLSLINARRSINASKKRE